MFLGQNKEYICTEVPNGCKQDLTFLVDLELLNSPEDVKCDGLGSWLNRSNVSTKFNYDGKIISDSKPYNCEIKTTYFTHQPFNNSKRRFVIVKLNEKPKYTLLLYKHEGGCKITDD